MSMHFILFYRKIVIFYLRMLLLIAHMVISMFQFSTINLDNRIKVFHILILFTTYDNSNNFFYLLVGIFYYYLYHYWCYDRLINVNGSIKYSTPLFLLLAIYLHHYHMIFGFIVK